MDVVLYVIAGLVVVLAGMGLILGLAAVMIAGECSEEERRRDAELWGSE